MPSFFSSFLNRDSRSSQYKSGFGSKDRIHYLPVNNATWTSRNYDNFALNGYIRNVIAHRAISMLSRASSGAQCLFSLVDGDTKIELPHNHPIVQLFKKPNPVTNYASFIQQAINSLLISGNIFIQGVHDDNGQIVEMYILRPDRVSVIPGIGYIPSSYQYTTGSLTLNFDCDQETGYSEILHIKQYHPLDDFYGLSPMEAAQYSIDQHNECIKWNKALLENGARPSGALVLKNNLTDEHFSRLKNELEEKFSGGANAGKVMILEGGIEWKEMSINPKNMDFIATKDSAARDIASAFGLPAQLLGIQGDNTYSNMEIARSAMWEETIIPMLNNVLSSIANWLSISYGEEIEICIDLDSIQAIASKQNETRNSVQQSDFISNSEKRDMFGFEEIAENKTKSHTSNPIEENLEEKIQEVDTQNIN